MAEYFAFQWHIFDDCDQQCKHCYNFAENQAMPLCMMNFEQKKKVVVSCEAFCSTFDGFPTFTSQAGIRS